MSEQNYQNFRKTNNCTRCKFLKEDSWGRDFGCYCEKFTFFGKIDSVLLSTYLCDLFEVDDE